MARDAILASVRAALSTLVPTLSDAASGVGAFGAPGVPRLKIEQDSIDICGLFIDTLSAYEATVTQATWATLPSKIAALVAANGVRSLAVPTDISRKWLEGLDAIDIIFDSPDLSYHDLARIDGSLTSSSFAIASTGTIGLTCQKDEGRRALTLLPDFHFCVVAKDSILKTVGDAFRNLKADNPVTLISGPSATSDIELVRVEGVHGPRNLCVLIVN